MLLELKNRGIRFRRFMNGASSPRPAVRSAKDRALPAFIARWAFTREGLNGAKPADLPVRGAFRERHDLLATAKKGWVANQQRAGLQLDEGAESGIDLAFGGCFQDTELQPLAHSLLPAQIG